MDESASTEPPPDQPVQKESGTLSWLPIAVILTTAMSVAAAHVPSRVRLIGLFSVAFGLMLGWLLVQLNGKLNANLPVKFIAGIAAVLTLLGLVGSTWQLCRLDAQNRAPSANESLALKMMEQMKSQMPIDGQQKDSPSNSLSEELDTSFRGYLSRRIRKLGHWSSPWPEVIWGTELLAGAAASFWIASRKPIA
jgi:hypothetical protein